jgi:hypothetical protein
MQFLCVSSIVCSILQLFIRYPNSVQEIEELIHSEKAKADCNYQTDPQVTLFLHCRLEF